MFTPEAQLCQEVGDILPLWAAHVQCHTGQRCSCQLVFVAPTGNEKSVLTAGGEGAGGATS